MVKKIKATLITTSVLYLILGIIMLFFPEFVSDFLCNLVACMFLFFGVAGVVMFIKTDIKTSYTNATLVLSIVLGAFGIYILLNPRAFASFIPLVTGIFLLVDSVSKLSAAFDLKKFGYNKWWHMLIVAFLILAFGIVLLIDPFGATTFGIMIIGSMLIIDSLTNIITIYSYSKINLN